jgi:putative methionine-R-sulfoxide reductase with GAF domain
MDRSSGRLPDPTAWSPERERRRNVRQKLYTPVYASFSGSPNGQVVDLSELLDLHEEGFAVQTSERLEINRAVTLCLDLPETRSFIHGTGKVIWSDDTGRGGIRFSALPESSRQILKEWLFANLLIGCSNHAIRSEQLAQQEREQSPQLVKAPNVVSISDRSEKFSRVEAGLARSQRATVSPQVEEISSEARASEIAETNDSAAVLQLVAERALNLTGASGAALAFVINDQMICSARAGELSPPLGTPIDSKQGLSGECIRTGLVVSCEDLEDDPRVDPEIGRALGIGSLLAIPIVSDFRVIGLLEVFSPYPHAFTSADATALEGLVEVGLVQKDRLVEMPPDPLEATLTEDPPIVSIPIEATQIEATPVDERQTQTPIISETVSDPLPPVGPEMETIEFASIRAIREELSEPLLNVRRPISPPTNEIISDEISDQLFETPSPAPSRLPHLILLGVVVAVVAMALGYLIGPIIEKRFAKSQQASQRPIFPAQRQSLADLRNRADHGDVEAQWQMAVRYHNGEGVPQDDAQAMLWFQLAAEQGNVDAQSHLGAYYWAGRGVPVDLSKAYMWSEIAVAGGDESSKSRLEGLAFQMTRAQMSDARQQAEAWINQHNTPESSKN